MSDSYQAVYDAVRSRIHNGDIGEAVASVCRDRIDLSNINNQISNAIQNVELELIRPSIMFKPQLNYRNEEWVVKYGDFTGIGKTPDLAMRNFDEYWSKKCT